MNISEWYDKETVDHLLTRDWFVDDDGICEVLTHADQEAWDWVVMNSPKFSPRVRKNIKFISSLYSPIETPKMKVMEIPDNMWRDIHGKHIRNMEAEFDVLWTEYLKTVPSRPKGNVDKHLDEVSRKIKEANDVMTQHNEMQKKKYLTPAARMKNVDMRMQELQATSLSLQAEFDRTQKLVNELEETFQRNKKREFRFKWLTDYS